MAADPFTILVVDDFPIMRGIIRRMLTKRYGVSRILEAEDGLRAWELLLENRIDLIICDWNMPKMNGLDLLKRVRSDQRYHQTPFVMVTSEDSHENLIQATREGVTGFLTKPFTAKDLGKKLKRILPEP